LFVFSRPWLARTPVVAALLLIAVVPVGAAGSSRETLPAQTVVRRVIDGDTVELADGRLVRYIGIDTPEVRRRARPGDREWRAGVGEAWVKDPEPYAEAATDANRRLVEGKTVHLEYDVQTHDRYGRLLAYVYVGDQMANDALLDAGYAQVMTIPPNVKYVERFRAVAARAHAAGRGLWAGR